ncbi:XRE family transcriptional regulator [Streptomyces griseoviridis]|uniref:Transcriptional regulator n=1 Tax=Streptomyces griseoviridis TaxID=45398 RepID=A0A3S9ZPA7_STRGD|nr:helix-turn-helix transcriptional regulator [Streptomyces griseoviridis]AZS89499.1 XRE family transcriptional regulator [Streptomyces griseoviridis]QCN83661.1 transcriptional regulator [Streptomyces griseoviridis]
MDTSDALRDFLISRRARLRPGDVGLPDHGVRRVSGLRREEIAALAAVSVEHYIRLERGQASRVSDAVLDAVADALRLSTGERRYLRSLARPAAGADGADRADATGRNGAVSGGRGVRPSVQRVLDSMTDTPAYLVGRGGAVLAWNRPAARVFVDFGRVPVAERTVGRLIFVDPYARWLYVDWEAKAREAVSYLRTETGKRPQDRELAREIGDLAAHSADFRRLWSEQHVLETTHATVVLRCGPPHDRLEFSWEALQMTGDPDEVVLVYTAAPGTPTASALRELCGAHRGGRAPR